MRVLWLGPARESLQAFLGGQGDTVTRFEDRIDGEHPVLDANDFIVSYGYRYLIAPAVLQRFNNRAINLHISFLPWNRGADPNVWSFLENTPKGVTIHAIDEHLDTGAIFLQSELVWTPADTLRTTYDRLSTTIESLFITQWSALKAGRLPSVRQAKEGSFHRRADLAPYRHLLTLGWDTPVSGLLGKAIAAKGFSQ